MMGVGSPKYILARSLEEPNGGSSRAVRMSMAASMVGYDTMMRRSDRSGEKELRGMG